MTEKQNVAQNVIVNVFEARALTEHELALDELWSESDGVNVVLHTAIHDGVRYVSNGMHYSGIPLSNFSKFAEVEYI